MSVFPTLSPFSSPAVYGGFGMGDMYGSPIAIVDETRDAPKPTDPAKPGAPIKRPYLYDSLTANATMPGFDAAPPWSWLIAWQMRRYSTIVFAHTIVCAPILAGIQTIEIIDDEHPQAEKIKEAAEADILPTVMDWLPGMLECLHFGHFLQEVEWQLLGDRTAPVAFHSVLPGEAIMYRDEYRRLTGFELMGEYRDSRYALLAVNNPHIDPIFGHARNQNCREEWWRVRQSEANADKTERKASGIQMGIAVPMGSTFTDDTGKAIMPKDMAQTIINAAVQGQTFTLPLTPFTKADIRTNPALADIPAVRVEKFDWGNIGPSIEAHLRRGASLKVDIIRAWHRPEREAMEGQHGTKAESETQGEIGTTDTELVAAMVLRQFTRQVLNRWAVTNFGPDAADVVAIRQAPLSDPQQEFLQKLAIAIAQDAATGPDFQLEFDKRELADKLEIPLRDETDVEADRQAQAEAEAEKQRQQQAAPANPAVDPVTGQVNAVEPPVNAPQKVVARRPQTSKLVRRLARLNPGK